MPIEFTRISSDARLTLVIDPQNGVPVPTRFLPSSRVDLDAAISDLADRERTKLENVGYVDLTLGRKCSSAYSRAANIIERWANAKRVGAVIWTDLPSNFKEKTGHPFTLERALEYLKALSDDEEMRAREYIQKAPPEVDTPLRHRLREAGWMDG